MSRLICLMMAAATALSTLACSVLDGDDRDDLESAIKEAPREDRAAMAAMVVGAKTRGYLQGRDPNSAVISLECRMVHPTMGPTGWSLPAGAFAKPRDLLACLQAGHTYPACLQFVADLLAERARKEWVKTKQAFVDSDPRKAADLECRGVVNPGFHAAEVPGANDDLNRVTAEAIVDWLLTLPAPPPGFSPATWRVLAPLLCGLDVGWGCSGHPMYPGGDGTIITVPGSTGGDP